ncbi:hypothetical protein AN958_06453 [Leucoagaricus sp. SymC.cos]|nr:hypothetical protein AN958_06453 [Leucoagaricus sp. SymC.cos]
MSTSQRHIVVDDVDPGIKYSDSGWSQDPNAPTGNFGAVYLQTLHKTWVDGVIEFSFTAFYLDYTYYLPSSKNRPFTDNVIWADNLDPAIHYDHLWTPYRGTQIHIASESGATVQIDSTGTSLTWVEIIPFDQPHTATTATYLIDEQKQYQIPLPGIPTGSTATAYKEIYFKTPKLEAGPHALTVMSQGSNETTPMALDFLYINDGTLASSAAAPSGGSGPSQPSPPSGSQTSDSRPSTPVGAAVGGVMGTGINCIHCSHIPPLAPSKHFTTQRASR